MFWKKPDVEKSCISKVAKLGGTVLAKLLERPSACRLGGASGGSKLSVKTGAKSCVSVGSQFVRSGTFCTNPSVLEFIFTGKGGVAAPSKFHKAIKLAFALGAKAASSI